MSLVEVEGCVFDAEQLGLSHGYASLDPIGREAFVNHVHFDTGDRARASDRLIESWSSEMRSLWPGREFRIYRQVEVDEVTVRFHMVRHGLPDWCVADMIEVIPVGGQEAEPGAAPDGRETA